MLKRRSLLLLGCPSFIAFNWSIAGQAESNALAEPACEPDLTSKVAPWTAVHDALIAEATSDLRKDIAAGLVDPGTVRTTECPICHYQFSINTDGHAA
jgi:hypothetical protein